VSHESVYKMFNKKAMVQPTRTTV